MRKSRIALGASLVVMGLAGVDSGVIDNYEPRSESHYCDRNGLEEANQDLIVVGSLVWTVGGLVLCREFENERAKYAVEERVD